MTVKQEIQDRIAAFAAELEQLVRGAAIEAVGNAFGTGAPRPAASRPSAGAVAASATATKPATRSRKKAGTKRDPKEIDALTAKAGAWIKANPGKTVENVGKALGAKTSELALPITRLLDSKTIKKTGQKRATKYFPR